MDPNYKSFHHNVAEKIDFRMKLLSGNNVVMLEAKGYESEIFVPKLHNGRLSLQNIIPNRRCCTAQTTRLLNTPYCRKNASTLRTPLTSLENRNNTNMRLEAGMEKTMRPLAVSTPANKDKFRTPGTLRSSLQKTTMSSRLDTPEPARCIPTPHDVIRNTLMKIPSGLKVVRLRPQCKRNGTSNSANIEYASPVNNSIGSDASATPEFSMQTPLTLSGSDTPVEARAEDSVPHHMRATQSSLRRSLSPIKPTTSMNINTTRKPATPTKTSTPRKPSMPTPAQTHTATKLTTSTPLNTAAKPTTQNQSLPRSQFPAQTSQAAAKKLVVPVPAAKPKQTRLRPKKRKPVKIDNKTFFSPNTLKKQLSNTLDLKRSSEDRLPSDQREYAALKYTAFDLLTNSNHFQHGSSKLNETFRKRCVNKASSTNPKFKLLSAVPPLQTSDKAMEDLNRALQQCQTRGMPDRRKRALMAAHLGQGDDRRTAARVSLQFDSQCNQNSR